ncbi:MAG: hypothetical protein ABW072_17385 [Sedimenticola sp.]
MKTRIILLTLLCLTISVTRAESLDYPNRYNGMAESMMDMMDAFSSAYEKRKGSGSMGFNSPQSGFGSMPGFGNPMSPMNSFGTMPGFNNPMSPMSGFGMPNNFNPGSMPFNSFGGAPAYNPWRAMPQFAPAPSITEQLDGSWQGQAGDMLVIRNGRFRIYRDKDNFREGRIHIENEQILSMQELSSGQSLRYEYAEQEGRLALRDEWGNLLLYRRVNQ